MFIAHSDPPPICLLLKFADSCSRNLTHIHRCLHPALHTWFPSPCSHAHEHTHVCMCTCTCVHTPRERDSLFPWLHIRQLPCRRLEGMDTVESQRSHAFTSELQPHSQEDSWQKDGAVIAAERKPPLPTARPACPEWGLTHIGCNTQLGPDQEIAPTLVSSLRNGQM